MKTLNEVITGLDICKNFSYCTHPQKGECPYLHEDNSCDQDNLYRDALYYLKEYWEKQNILKGKWQVTSIKGETWGICSNCNFKQKAGELNFCPNCGADMREDIPIEYFENGGI